MAPERISMDRFRKEWERASAAALPPVDLGEGAQRLLRAQNERRGARKRGRHWSWLPAAALLVVVATVLLVVRAGRTQAVTLDGAPLAVGAHVAAGAEDRLFQFSEGSTITLAAESNLDVRAAEARDVAVTLGSGAAKFDVVKRPGTNWTIDAGPFQVQVLGTAFRVDWSPSTQRFAVSVTRGTVAVKGPILEHIRAIEAGKRCVVDLKASRAAVEPIAHENEASSPGELKPDRTAESSDAASEVQASESSAHPLQGPVGSEKHEKARPARAIESAAGPRVGWRELERMGRFDKAVEEAERSGLDAIYDLAPSPDLMSLARAARFVGRQDVSAGALISCRRRFPGSRDAAMAAYLLGRNASPAEAVRWFSTYLAEQPRGAWAREAAGRLVETQLASGNAAAAREAAQKYLVQYPSGPHAKFAKEVLER